MSKPKTLVHQLERWAQETPNAHAIHGKLKGTWKRYTWKEYWEAVRNAAKGFISLGHEVGDCVAIVGANRTDWVIAQFGMMAARGVPAPIYVTNTEEQAAYIVKHSRAKIAVCDTKAQLDKLKRCQADGLISVEKIVTMDAIDGAGDDVMSFEALIERGKNQDDAELDKRLGELTTEETALLIYTSGTTGVPKAVQLDHGGMVACASAILARMGVLASPERYRTVSYLPLCHVAEQLFTNLLHLGTGGQVYFCPDLAEIKDYLLEVRPTLFLGVPRVWEKFQAALEAKLAEATGIKAKLAAWARAKELESFKEEVATGGPVDSFSRRLANKLVISKVKGALGLDQLQVAATGAAPISVGTLEFFASLGICIYEGYGMSETTGVSTCPHYGKPRFGTVGTALDGVEVRIAGDGEILLRGRIMTRGYLHMPDETKELYEDGDDWLHTGDLGTLDNDGFLKITGRKKDLLITAGGKNVAPAEMEAYIQQITGVGQAVVVGDRQPYLCALVTLDPEALPELTSQVGVPGGSIKEVAQNQKVHDYLLDRIARDCNEKVARYQTIKKIKVLPVEFSVDTGELTPTMKVKRNVVNDKYKDAIEAMYA